MLKQQDNHVFLSRLLNEFYDDFSYYFLTSQEKMREGLNVKLTTDDKGYHLISCSNPYKTENMLLERIRHIESWFVSQVAVHDLSSISLIIENHQYNEFKNIIVFDGDEFIFHFKQGSKSFEHKVVISKSAKIRSNSDNVYLNLKLERLGFRIDRDVLLTVKLNNCSELRNVILTNINNMSESDDKFFNYFYNNFLLKKPEMKKFSKMDLEMVNIYPKGFYSIYIICMERNSKSQPKAGGFISQLTNRNRQELSDLFMVQYKIFQQQIQFIEANKMPFWL